MRDPRQLELNFDLTGPALTTAEQDALVKHSLEMQSIRVYVCTVARGHKAWADLNAPSYQELLLYRDHLDNSPLDTGHHYRSTLDQLIHQHTAELIQRCSELRQPFVDEEVAQGLHATCWVNV